MKRLLCVSNHKNITSNEWNDAIASCMCENAMLNKMHIYKSILCPVVLYLYTTIANTAASCNSYELTNSHCICHLVYCIVFMENI